ncbi:hypothetical protein L2E82_12718 [Cichorium intybus]|uniref:Uncharacterized protein n=1 Tax=Cichorium intybus TaxID=13427 RepID=A0ACB9GHW3_CICIN|nr:hypothetical protein L2E82_12718 [Cichorium intybus]
MEGREGQSSIAAARYTLPPSRLSCEDILFCIDVDPKSLAEMKNASVSGRPFTRLESIKQAILLFINAKLAINPDHRFTYCALGKTPFWVIPRFDQVGYVMLSVENSELKVIGDDGVFEPFTTENTLNHWILKISVNPHANCDCNLGLKSALLSQQFPWIRTV